MFVLFLPVECRIEPAMKAEGRLFLWSHETCVTCLYCAVTAYCARPSTHGFLVYFVQGQPTHVTSFRLGLCR